MASKGQKFNKYSEEFKDEILEKLNKGFTSNYLAKEYNISRGTILTWMNKRRKQGDLKNDIYHNRGRKKERNLSIEDYKERYEILVNGKIKCRNSVNYFVGFPTFFIC